MVFQVPHLEILAPQGILKHMCSSFLYPQLYNQSLHVSRSACKTVFDACLLQPSCSERADIEKRSREQLAAVNARVAELDAENRKLREAKYELDSKVCREKWLSEATCQPQVTVSGEHLNWASCMSFMQQRSYVC